MGYKAGFEEPQHAQFAAVVSWIQHEEHAATVKGLRAPIDHRSIP